MSEPVRTYIKFSDLDWLLTLHLGILSEITSTFVNRIAFMKLYGTEVTPSRIELFDSSDGPPFAIYVRNEHGVLIEERFV